MPSFSLLYRSFFHNLAEIENSFIAIFLRAAPRSKPPRA
jgi:hypothetical protein